MWVWCGVECVWEVGGGFLNGGGVKVSEKSEGKWCG